MGKNTVNISPLIENQKVEIRVEEIINDTEVLTLHKYSLDGEKYQIKIKLNPNDEPEIICEEGNGKIIREVKKEVKKTIYGDRRIDLVVDLKKALSELGIEESAYGVFNKAIDNISKYFGITPDNEEPKQKIHDSYCRFFNHKNYYLLIFKKSGFFVLIISANVGKWEID